MKICIIGFGTAGIVAARYSSVDHECHVFERNNSLGGTWIYTEKTGNDHFGLPIHTSMYKNLRTNLPKELMGFSDFEVSEDKNSFLTSEEVLDFLKSYVQHFDLKKLVKFGHIVEDVTPEKNGWKVQVKNLINNEKNSYRFDAVIVCNGHHSVPIYPKISGMDTFPGFKIHSHEYRHPEYFKDKKVLVIGGSYSGVDISFDISSVANDVLLSFRRDKPENILSEKIQAVSEVEKVQGSTIVFKDGRHEEVDAIVFCTGYSYSFPFLNPNCGIKIEDEYVSPLFKQIININYPTMAFIGIPTETFLFPLFEIQVKCFLRFLGSHFPSKEEMISDTKKRESAILQKELPLKWCHMLFDDAKPYLDDIAILGGVDPLPDSIFELFKKSTCARKKNLLAFRNQTF